MKKGKYITTKKSKIRTEANAMLKLKEKEVEVVSKIKLEQLELCRNCGEKSVNKNEKGVKYCRVCENFLCPSCGYLVEIEDSREGSCLRCQAKVAKESLFIETTEH